MTNRLRNRVLRGVLAAAVTGLVGCDEFVSVKNPNQLEAEAIDAEKDRTILSQSAFQSFVAAYGDLNMHAAWFTMESRVGDTFPTRNDFGRRQISALTNGDNENRWNGIHVPLAYSENTIRDIEAGGEDLGLARLYFTSGYLMLIQAEVFCTPTILLGRGRPGNLLTT
ncbi:MAG: hypothetical protein ACREMA_18065, partial [Longimicrobiales bacterium]